VQGENIVKKEGPEKSVFVAQIAKKQAADNQVE
jgi:hypothetical protein